MKPLSLLIGLSIGLAVSARGNVVLNESFSYPDGSLVGAPGSPWQNHSGTTPITVTNGAIRVSFSGSEDANALLSGQPYTTTSAVSLYSSFKVRFTALPSLTGSYFAHFKDANTGAATGFGGRVWASTTNAAAGQFRLSIGNGSGANATNAQVAMDLFLETNYLVVTRFVPATGIATMWINPTAESDPSVTATDESATRPNPIDVAAYAFRQSGGIGTMWVDDLRVGTAFNDVAGPNNPPSISGIASQSGPASTAIGPVAFTVGDAETAAESLTLTKISTNTALVPDSNIVFGGSGSNRTVTVTPVAGAQGRTTITVTVSDGTSESSTSFLVSIGLPSISSIADQQIPINSFPAPIPFTIGDAETPASLTLQGLSSNEALVPNANISFEGGGSSRSVVIVPATDVSGLTTITITVSDGEVTAEESFVLTVHPVLGLLKADDFNRPDGPLIRDDGLWLSHSGTLFETQITNNQVRLSSSQSEDVSTEPSGAPFTPSAGYVLYSSFRINFTQLPTASGGYFAHFKDDGNGFRGRVYANTANAPAGSFRLGIANNAAAIAANSEWPANLSTGTTYTVVTRYNVGTGVSTLWVDPASESTAGITAQDAPSSITVWYYAFRQTAGIGTLYVDDLKVGGSFASVFTSRPRLQILRAGSDVEISWLAAADGYGLESSATFNSWADVTEQPTVVGERKVVTISGVTGNLFFRLKAGPQ